MKNKGWKILQIIQLIIFLCFSAFLFARTVDGHGTVQTLEVKLISFAIWAAFYLGVLAIEWLIYVIVRRSIKQIKHMPIFLSQVRQVLHHTAIPHFSQAMLF